MALPNKLKKLKITISLQKLTSIQGKEHSVSFHPQEYSQEIIVSDQHYKQQNQQEQHHQEREERFLSLMLPIKDSLSCFINALEHDRTEARDIMSETIALAFEHFERLSHEVAFLSWTMTIARRLIYRKQRRLRREIAMHWITASISGLHRHETTDSPVSENTIDSLLPHYQTHSEPTPDKAVDIQLLYDALEHLPLKQREALILSDVMDYDLQEIAYIQSASLSAVKQRVVRGRARLKAILQDAFSALP